MTYGVGIDIIKIKKMRDAVDKWGDLFLNRIFNNEEITGISQGKMYYQRLAARFAAKEAVFKALSGKHLISFRDMLILNYSNGAPYCEFKKDINIEIFLRQS